MQTLTITGNLGRDPEMRHTSKGTTFLTFSVAVRNWFPAIGDEDAHEETEWYNVTLWSPTDYQTANLVKGAKVLVSGEFRRREYRKKDGDKGQSMEIHRTHTVELIGAPRNQDSGDEDARPVAAAPRGNGRPARAAKEEENPDLEDLPF